MERLCKLKGNLVIGDSLIVEEGASIPDNESITQSNIFSVNISILTREFLRLSEINCMKTTTCIKKQQLPAYLSLQPFRTLEIKPSWGKLVKVVKI